MKKLVVILLLAISLFAFSGCQKEPSLADQIKESTQRLEDAKKREKEAKEKERELQNAVDTLKKLQQNAGQ